MRNSDDRALEWVNTPPENREIISYARYAIVSVAALLLTSIVMLCVTAATLAAAEEAAAGSEQPCESKMPDMMGIDDLDGRDVDELRRESHDASDDLFVPAADAETAVPEEDPDAEYVTFRVSAYCPCAYCCGRETGITYSGAAAEEGVTVGADLDVLPIGSVVYIEGIGYRTVQDTGNFTGYKLDLFFENHEDALNFGVRDMRVKIIKIGETT